MIIAHNGTCTMHCDLLTDMRIAREAGYEGIEIIGAKLYRHLNRDGSLDEVAAAESGMATLISRRY